MSQPEIPQFGTNPTHHGIDDNPFMLFFANYYTLGPSISGAQIQGSWSCSHVK